MQHKNRNFQFYYGVVVLLTFEVVSGKVLFYTLDIFLNSFKE